MRKPHLYVVLALAACTPDDPGPAPTADIGYEFFPLQVGAYIEYKADSIYHDRPSATIPGVHDTSSYYIREVAQSEFLDAAGEPSIRLERYKRNTLQEDWQLVDVWFQKRTAMNAQRVEENLRYIKLGFPTGQGSTWDGNALNILDPWIYRIDSVGVPRTYHGLDFPRTLTVVQRINKNFVEDEYAYEIYAYGVGLVYRFHRDLETRFDYTDNPVAENIRRGIEFTWEVIDYGVE